MILGFYTDSEKMVGFHRAVLNISYFFNWAILNQYFYRSQSGLIRKNIEFHCPG